MDAMLAFLAPLMGTLAGKYGIVVTIIAWLGTIRLFIKPVMTIAEVYAASTSSLKDDEILAKVKTSKYYTWVLFGIDWLLSLKLGKTEVKKVA